MVAQAIVADAETLEKARELVKSLEICDEDKAKKLVEELSQKQGEGLFQELGKLTRDLHDALNSFQLDTRISEMAETEIPDAKERLRHVITMTDEAAHRTLNAVEDSMPIAEKLKQQTRDLESKWSRFRRNDMVVEEFRSMMPEIDSFLADTNIHAEKLNASLSDILMAQDFQDLTGQIIRRVITLVTDVEENLVQIIRISGQNMQQPTDSVASSMAAGLGPQVPGVDNEGAVSNQDDVDDLLSSLGF